MKKTDDRFSSDDRGNVVDFFENYEDGTWEKCARLDREAGNDANSLHWENFCGGDDLEKWAYGEGYFEEITEAKGNNCNL